MKYRSLGLIAIALVAAAAHAQEDAHKRTARRGASAHARAQQHFDRLDANGDGRIDRSEARKSKRLSTQFDALDADKNGTLSPQEATALQGRQGGKGRHGGRKSRKSLKTS